MPDRAGFELKVRWLHPSGDVVLQEHARIENGKIARNLRDLGGEVGNRVLVTRRLEVAAQRPQGVEFRDSCLVEVLKRLPVVRPMPSHEFGRRVLVH